MNLIHIHYDPSRNGEIVSWLSGATRHDYSSGNASHLGGCLVTTIEIPEGCEISVNPKTQRIDIETEELIDKADDEIAHAMLPTLFEVQAAILSELESTDKYAAPPSDMPRRGAFALDWLPYRAALRALSKLPRPVAMVKAWPARPDGVDPIAHLSQRVSGAG